MDTEDFDGIMAGLGDALAYVKGDGKSGRVVAGPDVRSIRSRVHLSQAKFASTYCLKLATLKDWEQGRRIPDGASLTLLKMIDADPEGVKQIIEKAGEKVDA
jgi:putative transcriptional regulator